MNYDTTENQENIKNQAKVDEAQVQEVVNRVRQIEAEVSRVMVGQGDVIRQILLTLMTGGHALLEGVPGLGKTLLVRTLGRALGLKFARIQFTPDLMPADIIGTNIMTETEQGRGFKFQQGAVFANLVLADEINRATPKTQSALLEAMQERTVSVAGITRPLPEPFFVLATQNPLEMEGTYPLPEAQMDRFLFKVLVDFPGETELREILLKTTGYGETEVNQVADAADLAGLIKTASVVPVATHVVDYIIRLILATHPERPEASERVRRYVRYGASPRGGQAILVTARIRALLEGRFNIAFEDVAAVALPALRHRFFLNFEGEAEGITGDILIKELLETVPKTKGVK
ncbi:AAA family ATPase [Phosphitispora sp. TUW77]|uniref:AAA family ATPase n=1 Tax=Phosphitispora sp. TUW77 TaxID=3152361 RepID=UPI003AB3B790